MQLTDARRNEIFRAMVRSETKPRSEAARHLKSVACRLFAERGVDGVTVRDIAEAAGQKNHAAVGYHFGSKDALIRELVVDGARVIDANRNAALDELEGSRAAIAVADVVDVLVRTSIDLAGSGLEGSYNRFVVMLGMTHRDVLMDALEDRWNSGYLRCFEHLRRLMPKMSPAKKNQRLIFVGACLGSVLAARETALADRSREHRTWGSQQMLDHFAATMTALIEASASA